MIMMPIKGCFAAKEIKEGSAEHSDTLDFDAA
jgi:hypothetical protein